jgi:hypothetical protein
MLVVALQVFPKWDPSKPPGPFLRVHLTRRIRNLYRDRVRRSDSPCAACKKGRWCGRGGEGGPCEAHTQWAERWGRKATLASGGVGSLAPDRAAPLDDPADTELLGKVDAELPAHLRADYLRLRQGVRLSETRRAAVEDAIRFILGIQT